MRNFLRTNHARGNPAATTVMRPSTANIARCLTGAPKIAGEPNGDAPATTIRGSHRTENIDATPEENASRAAPPRLPSSTTVCLSVNRKRRTVHPSVSHSRRSRKGSVGTNQGARGTRTRILVPQVDRDDHCARYADRKAGTIETLQSVSDAFLNAPLLFLVPLLLLAFILWAPWSPRNFYLHQHDLEHLENQQPTPAAGEKDSET
jgi:hypothetical protein